VPTITYKGVGIRLTQRAFDLRRSPKGAAFSSISRGLLEGFCALTLAACGGGSMSGSAPVQSTPAALAPARVAGDGLLAYIGDDLVVLGCSASYNAPYPTFETDTPNATCSAVQGETSAQTLARLPAVLDQHPKVVVILTGFNDVRTADPSTDAISEMVQEAQAQGVIVILCDLPPSAGFDAEIQAWNVKIKLISQTYGTQFADLYAGIENPSSVPDVPKYSAWVESGSLLDAQGIYPNANGYLVIWDVICESTDLDGVESQ
jgi:GDSL-like Lipase/Acylhydrolase family